MFYLNKQASKVMDTLTDGLNIGDSRKIENSKGFMAVHVEKVNLCDQGPIFSITHYYEQNGDLMSDPDMTFIKMIRENENFYIPMTYQQDGLGIYQEVFDWDGTRLGKYRPKLLKDLVSFANMWMKNIKEQQHI